MSDKESTNGPDQSGDLFSYIGGAGFQAVEDESLVQQMSSEAPVVVSDQDGGGNVDQAASSVENAPGVTNQQQAGNEGTAEANQSPQGPSGDEALRLQQRIQQLEADIGKRDTALAMVASQARKREEELFNASLQYMTEEEQEQAKEKRRIDQIVAENNLLRSYEQRRSEYEAAAQENVDKVEAVHKVMSRLGLPANDQFVMQALMESQNPYEMVAVARRLHSVYSQNQQAAEAKAAERVANSVTFAAGGESAPSAPQKRTPQRSGELVDMMRERQYATEVVG